MDAVAFIGDSFSLPMSAQLTGYVADGFTDRKKRGYRVVLTQLLIASNAEAEGKGEEILRRKVPHLWPLEATDSKEVSGTQLTKVEE
jgi:hypothetical protein